MDHNNLNQWPIAGWRAGDDLSDGSSFKHVWAHMAISQYLNGEENTTGSLSRRPDSKVTQGLLSRGPDCKIIKGEEELQMGPFMFNSINVFCMAVWSNETTIYFLPLLPIPVQTRQSCKWQLFTMFSRFAILLATIPTLVWGLDQTTCNQNAGRTNSIAHLGTPYNGCVACVTVELADAFNPEISINPDAANVWMSKGCFSKSLGVTSPCGDAYGYALGAGSLFFDTDPPACSSSEDIAVAVQTVLYDVQDKNKISYVDFQLAVGPDTGLTQSLYSVVKTWVAEVGKMGRCGWRDLRDSSNTASQINRTLSDCGNQIFHTFKAIQSPRLSLLLLRLINPDHRQRLRSLSCLRYLFSLLLICLRLFDSSLSGSKTKPPPTRQWRISVLSCLSRNKV